LWQADLIVMEKYGRVNKGFKYILTMIGCLSGYAYVRPLKTKSAQEVLSALKIFINQNLHPKMLQTDQGKEFFNALVKKFLSSFGICHFHNFSEKKACVIERFNRTLMMRPSKIFSLRKSFRYYNVLDEVVKAYNNTVHSATKQCPVNFSTSICIVVQYLSTISLMCGLNLTRNYSAERQKTKKQDLQKILTYG